MIGLRNPLNGTPATFTAFGSVFTAAQNGSYTGPNGQVIVYVAGDNALYVSSGLTAQSRDRVTFFGGTVLINGNASGFRNAALLVPASAFGASDVVTSSTLARKFYTNFSGGISTGQSSNGQTYADPQTALTSYMAYADFVKNSISNDPITVESPNFSSIDANRNIALTYTTLTTYSSIPPADYAPDGFRFVQTADSSGNLIVTAGGNVSDQRSGDFSIDSFVLTRGLAAADLVGGQLPTLTAVTGQLPALATSPWFRYFLPDIATPAGIPAASIAATPLLVVNPSSTAAKKDFAARIFQADLGVSADGRQSTASVTLGAITYASEALSNPPQTDDDFNQSVGLVAKVGSSKETDALSRSLVSLIGRTTGASSSPVGGTTAEPTGGPVLIESPLVATSVGGGRKWLGTAAASGLRPGYAGYLVLENANTVDPANTADSKANEVPGGTIAPLGAPATSYQTYGLLRLASGVTTTATRNTAPTSGPLAGFVAGAAEYETATGNVVTPYLGTISVTPKPDAGSVDASVTYALAVTGAATPVTHTVALGDAAAADGQSSYVDPAHFGASTTGAAKAGLVAGEAVKSGLPGGAGIKTYAHVQWGFFFGDLMSEAGKRAFTALSSWVAGERYNGANADVGADSAMRGEVRFGGHAIGTVVRQPAGASADIATAVGSFAQVWNLNARTGSMDLSFDGQAYNGIPLAVAGPNGLAYAGRSAQIASVPGAAALQAQINGELVNVPTPTALPGGKIGSFQVRGVDAAYQANGTFAGDRTSP